MLFIRDLKPKLNKQSDSIRAKLFVLTLLIVFLFFPLLINTSFSRSVILFYCSYVNTCFFFPVFQKLYIRGIVLSMNLNMKMTLQRSNHPSFFLSLVFITKCFTNNLLLGKKESQGKVHQLASRCEQWK